MPFFRYIHAKCFLVISANFFLIELSVMNVCHEMKYIFQLILEFFLIPAQHLQKKLFTNPHSCFFYNAVTYKNTICLKNNTLELQKSYFKGNFEKFLHMALL